MAGQSPQSIIQSSRPTTPPSSSSDAKILTINFSIIKSNNSTFVQLWRDNHHNQSFNRQVPQLHLPHAVAGQSSQLIVQSSSLTTPPTLCCRWTCLTLRGSPVAPPPSILLLVGVAGSSPVNSGISATDQGRAITPLTPGVPVTVLWGTQMYRS